jgi:hypothetical protein
MAESSGSAVRSRRSKEPRNPHAYSAVYLGNAQIDTTVETRGADHADELMTHLR